MKNLSDLDKQTLWHPFTQMQEWIDSDNPIIAVGEGPYLIDTAGRRYLDGVSSLWTNVHGHRHPALDQAVIDQLGRIAHSTLLGLSNVPSIEFAARLIRLLPGDLTRVFYSDNGSTAVEVALKIAFHHFQNLDGPDKKRTRFMTFKDAYHGDTVGSVSLGGIDLFHQIYRPLLFDAYRADYPYCYRCPLGLSHPECELRCLSGAEKIMAEHGSKICAVVIEPLVQGAAGIHTAPLGFLAGIRRLCDKFGALLICDEVATGFGRTGRMFASQWESVSPDLICLAKGISGGYLPLAVTATTEKVFNAFLGPADSNRQFFHGHTYTGNPLACAAALASLDIFDREKLIDRLPAKVEALADRLAAVAELTHVGDVRQRGLMIGVELVYDKKSKKPYDPTRRTAVQVILEARRQGLIIRPLGDVIVLMPPLCCTIDQLQSMVDTVKRAIRTVTET